MTKPDQKETLQDWVAYSRLASRTGIGAIVGGIGLATATQPGAAMFGMAALLALAGSVIRFWSAGIISKNRELAATGPYAYVRNPLYSGSLLIGIAFLMLNGNPYFVVPVCVAAVVLYLRTIQNEEAVLTERFGEKYETYRQQVPAIIPWKGRCQIDGAEASYSLEQSLFNKEYNGVMGTLGMLALFYLYMNWIPESTFRIAAGVLVVAYLVGRALSTGRRSRRERQEFQARQELEARQAEPEDEVEEEELKARESSA